MQDRALAGACAVAEVARASWCCIAVTKGGVLWWRQAGPCQRQEGEKNFSRCVGCAAREQPGMCRPCGHV